MLVADQAYEGIYGHGTQSIHSIHQNGSQMFQQGTWNFFESTMIINIYY